MIATAKKLPVPKSAATPTTATSVGKRMKKDLRTGPGPKEKKKFSFPKDIFCGHIYEQINEKYLRIDREVIGAFSSDYKVTAVTEKCIKCGKERVWERKIRVCRKENYDYE